MWYQCALYGTVSTFYVKRHSAIKLYYTYNIHCDNCKTSWKKHLFYICVSVIRKYFSLVLTMTTRCFILLNVFYLVPMYFNFLYYNVSYFTQVLKCFSEPITTIYYSIFINIINVCVCYISGFRDLSIYVIHKLATKKDIAWKQWHNWVFSDGRANKLIVVKQGGTTPQKLKYFF